MDIRPLLSFALVALTACASPPSGAPYDIATPADHELAMATPALPDDADEAWATIAELDWPAQQTAFRGYAGSVKDALWEIYAEGGIELYCRATFTAADAEARKANGQALTWEHVAPASHLAAVAGFGNRDCEKPAGGAEPQTDLCLAAISDLHNLLPAYGRINSSRGDSAFAELPGEGTTSDAFASFCPDYERTYGQSPALVEPTDDARGDIARALVYMHEVYGLPLDRVVADRDLLLVWMEQDPVDAEEARIAALKASRQGSANPLVVFALPSS